MAFKKTLSFLSMDFDWKLTFGQEACIDNTADNSSMGSYHLAIPLTIAVQGSFLSGHRWLLYAFIRFSSLSKRFSEIH